MDYVGVGTSEGAKLLVGGERLKEGAHARGYFSSPAVMTEVAPTMRVAQEEIFGPVLAVLPASSLDHAIEISNGIRFGLSAGICTSSLSSAYEFINRIEAGLVMVNLPSAGVEYHVPFGGSKASSLGMREQGGVAVDFYSEWQTAYLKYLRGLRTGDGGFKVQVQGSRFKIRFKVLAFGWLASWQRAAAADSSKRVVK